MRPLSAGKMTTKSSFPRDFIASLSALLMFDLGGLLQDKINEIFNLSSEYLKCLYIFIVLDCNRVYLLGHKYVLGPS